MAEISQNASNEMQMDNKSLEYWLTRATDPYLSESSRPGYVQGFCDQINEELEGPQVACRLLAHKIQSPYHIEALHALKLLDACVRNCGVRFHNEIGKFRFLNEIIKILSPKYMGQQTNKEVKTRAIEMLYSWKKSLKMQSKISQAYDMLKEQSVITQDPVYMDEIYEPPPDPPKPRQATFEDEEKSRLLAQLLISRNPEDLQAANRLIKSMVKAEDQKMEKMGKRCEDLQTAGNNAALLHDMVKSFQPTSATKDDIEIMKELSDALSNIRSTLYRYASEAAEGGEDALASVLSVNDEVSKAIDEFKSRVQPYVATVKSSTSMSTESFQSNANALAALLSFDDASGAMGGHTPSDTCSLSSDDVGLLGGFGTPLMPRKESAGKTNNGVEQTHQNNSQLMEKLQQLANEKKCVVAGSAAVKELSRPKGLADLDALSESLIHSNLPPNVQNVRQDSIKNNEQRQKVPMRELYSSPPSLSPLDPKPKSVPTLVPNEQNVRCGANSVTPEASDLLVDFSPEREETPPAPADVNPPSPVKATPPPSLDDVNLDLMSVRPSGKDPVTVLDEEKIKVVVHYTCNRPRDNVMCCVLSITSLNQKPVNDIRFLANLLDNEQFGVKLLPPTLTSLPPFNPIFPPQAVSQIVMITSNKKEEKTLHFNYKFDFNCGEPRTLSGKFPLLFSLNL